MPKWFILLTLLSMLAVDNTVANKGSDRRGGGGGGSNNPSTSCTNVTGPFFYVTFHDTPANIIKFSLAGCMIGPVLNDATNLIKTTQLRAMSLLNLPSSPANSSTSALQDGYLFVNNADVPNCAVLVYSPCITGVSGSQNRNFVTTATNQSLNPGLLHPYGLVVTEELLLVSNQHSDNVLRYRTTQGANLVYQPAEFPPPVVHSPHVHQMFYGTFVQYGLPGEHDVTEQGVRDIELVYSSSTLSQPDQLWVANEDMLSILIYSASNASLIDTINTGPDYMPVGLYFDAGTGLVFLGVKPVSGKGDGAVYGLDPSLHVIRTSYTDSSMNHPAGMTVFANTLYVLEQANDKLLSFDIPSGHFLSVVIPSFSTFGFSQAEQIILSSC